METNSIHSVSSLNNKMWVKKWIKRLTKYRFSISDLADEIYGTNLIQLQWQGHVYILMPQSKQLAIIEYWRIRNLNYTLIVILRTILWSKTFPIMCPFHIILRGIDFGHTFRSKRTKLVTPWALIHIIFWITSINYPYQIVNFHLFFHFNTLAYIPINWSIHSFPFETDVCNISSKCPLLWFIKIQRIS